MLRLTTAGFATGLLLLTYCVPSSAQTVSGLEEIVVTATRSAESISKVPLSITALDQAQMDTQGFRSFDDIARITPGAVFHPNNGKVVIRGIEGSTAGAATVGIYIDDTPIQARSFGTYATDPSPLIFDLQRVEVLRGPQGTLYGAGSLGGTVRYIMNTPNLEKFELYGRAEGNAIQGGGEGGEGGLAVGGPIVQDKLGFRVSGWFRHSGGYIDRVDKNTGALLDKNINRENDAVFRGALTFKPTDSLTITPSIQYQRRNVNDDLNVAESSSGIVAGLSDREHGVFRTGNLSPNTLKDRYYVGSLNVQFKASFADVIYNGSYFHRDAPSTNDYANFIGNIFGLVDNRGTAIPGLPNYTVPTEVNNFQRNWTHELRLQSNDSESRFKWVAGAFLQRNEQRNEEIFHDKDFPALWEAVFGPPAPPLLPPDISYSGHARAKEQQTAIFAEGTYSLTDAWKITLGGRYAKTKFESDNVSDGAYNGGLTSNSGSVTEHPFVPKVAFSYQADDRNLFYVSASKGYRIGGTSAPIPAAAGCDADLAALGFAKQPDNYKSDSAWQYEVGSKNSLLENRLKLASSIYVINWKNIQQQFALPTCGFLFTTNVGKARSSGFDVQATVAATDNLDFGLLIGYTNARFSESILAGTASDGGPLYLSANGDKLYVPTWTGTLTGDYSFRMLGQDTYVHLDYSYIGPTVGDVVAQNPRAATFDPNFHDNHSSNFATARIGVRLNDGLDVSLFATNLFNTRSALTSTHLTPGSPLYFETVYQPRTIGLTLVYRK